VRRLCSAKRQREREVCEVGRAVAVERQRLERIGASMVRTDGRAEATGAAVDEDPEISVDVAIQLESTFLRRVFMKAAVALVHADGVYTDNERRVIGEFAEAFGLSHTEFGELEQAAKMVDLTAAE